MTLLIRSQTSTVQPLKLLISLPGNCSPQSKQELVVDFDYTTVRPENIRSMFYRGLSDCYLGSRGKGYLIHLTQVPNVCVSESGQHRFR